MKILNFGSCNIDYVYTVDHIVKAHETETTDSLEVFPGGKGLNQSVAIARAGTLVYHAGCLGNDADILLNTLKDSGVDISYMKSVDIKNGHAIIQVDLQGTNSIFIYPGSNAMITCDFVDSVLENFEADDIILLQNEINNIEHIICKAYKKGMRIILNPSPFNEKITALDMNMISYLILNEIEAKEIFGSDSTEVISACIHEKYKKLKVMLTLGGNGCVYIDKDTEIYQPIFEVTAVDTTAAGDTFTGYFIAELSKGTSYEEILRTASCASAVSVSRNGAAPSIPTMQEVTHALKHLREKKRKKDYALQEAIENYITENIKTVTLYTLSSFLGYSCVYTGSIVKRLYAKPFTKVLQDKRCEIAAKMLAVTQLSTDEIIESVGYENKSFFRKLFKEKYGKNMLTYKKR